MATSIQDVAREAGVSISTVSRSFTRPDLVSAKTRERVLAIADKLNFSLSRSAAALKSGRSRFPASRSARNSSRCCRYAVTPMP